MIYEGSSTILAQPLMTFPSDQLTALDATVVNHYIVAFVGTAEGKVKKVMNSTEIRSSSIANPPFSVDQHSTYEEKGFRIRSSLCSFW